MNSNSPDCMRLMKRIHDVMEKDANSNLERHGITFAQVHMLMTLNHREEQGLGAMKLKELERHFGVAQSTAAGIAVRLERKHLVTSFTDESDKRIKWLQITESGREVCRDTRASIEKSQSQFLSGLTREEQEEFTRLLRKVYDNLTRS